MKALLALVLWGLGGTPQRPLAGTADQLALYAPAELAVSNNGMAVVDLAGGATGRIYWIVVGNADTSDRPMELRTTRTAVQGSAARLRLQSLSPDGEWAQTTSDRRREMRQRRLEPRGSTYVSAKLPAEKSFHLFVKENDFLENAGYREVHAKLAACGTHCVVYLDRDDWSTEFLNTTVAEAVATFDSIVYPQARALFGEHLDVDRNGKFTILFTHWLGQLSDGKVSLGGFVRGADFYRDVEPPLSNRCDMLYLNTNLKPGANLRSLLAHEYTHAITFSEHVFGRYLANATGADDEAWLSEAIAHLAENLIGKGYANLDHRVSAYLTAPERYRLVVPDYYRAGLWRCHGCRGATYLFLRWIVDQYGTGVLAELARSNLAGIQNLEAATQTPFAELFRNWCVSTVLAGLDPAARQFDYPTIDLRGRLETRQLAGVRIRELPSGTSCQSIAGTAMAPLEVRVAQGITERIVLAAPGNANLQATLVRMPDDLPKVELTARPTIAENEKRPVRLEVGQAAGAVVHWQHVTWELAYPPQIKTPESQTAATIMACPELFAKLGTATGQVLSSDAIDIGRHGARSVVVKVSGQDAKGRRVAAWTVVPPNAAAAGD